MKTNFRREAVSDFRNVRLDQPLELKTGKAADKVLLDASSKVQLSTGKGDDQFVYSGKSIANTDGFFYGGSGTDKLSISDTNAGDALKALKNGGYSLELGKNGFALVTKEGKKAVFSSVEVIAFKDKSFDLTDKKQLKEFVSALKGASIPVNIKKEDNCGCPKEQGR